MSEPEVRESATNSCNKCNSLSGVYYDLCDDCMTRFNQLESRNKEHARPLDKPFEAETEYLYKKKIAKLEEKIQQMHKDYGCELRDPNGTIWEHANNLQIKVNELEAELIEQAKVNCKLFNANKALREALENSDAFMGRCEASANMLGDTTEENLIIKLRLANKLALGGE